MKSSPILAVYLSRSLRSWRRAKNPANEGGVRCRKDLCYLAFFSPSWSCFARLHKISVQNG